MGIWPVKPKQKTAWVGFGIYANGGPALKGIKITLEWANEIRTNEPLGTNELGYSQFKELPPNTNIKVTIIEQQGYKPFIKNYNFVVGDQNVMISLDKKLPDIKSRDVMCSIKNTFQGLSIDYQGNIIPWFDIFLPSLNQINRNKVYDLHHSINDKHILLSISYKYEEVDYVYPVPPNDFTNNLQPFKDIVLEILSNGFIPIISLASDGQNYNPEGNTYGWQWGMNNMERIISFLGDDIRKRAIFFGGFELIGGGGNWSSQQIDEYYIKLRSIVKDDGFTMLHMNYCKWYEPGDNGNGGWSNPSGLTIDILAQELPDQPCISYTNGQLTTGTKQYAARTLGPAYLGDHQGDNPNPPWYMANGTPRGPFYVWLCEYDLYRWIRSRVSSVEIERQRQALLNNGYKWVG